MTYGVWREVGYTATLGQDRRWVVVTTTHAFADSQIEETVLAVRPIELVLCGRGIMRNCAATSVGRTPAVGRERLE